MTHELTTDSGYVGLLDVPGFRALISGAGNARLAQYLACVDRTIKEANLGVDYAIFSDSIVLTERAMAFISTAADMLRFNRHMARNFPGGG